MVIVTTWLMAGVIYRLLNIILDDDDAAWYKVNDSPSELHPHYCASLHVADGASPVFPAPRGVPPLSLNSRSDKWAMRHPRDPAVA
jgi:hypothetical protein